MIPADDLAAAGLLCAHCRGELGYFIEEGRIIVEPSEDEEEIDEGEIWDALREYLPEDLCGMRRRVFPGEHLERAEGRRMV